MSMIVELSNMLRAAGIPNLVLNRGIVRQIRLRDGDVMEGHGIKKLQTYGFGYELIEDLSVDEAYRLIMRIDNPRWNTRFTLDSPAGTLVSEDSILKLYNEGRLQTFLNDYAQLSSIKSYEKNPISGKTEPVYGTFHRYKFDTWEWRGYHFKGYY